MKRVLITGITGYIGSHLARQLLTDCEVYGLVREPLHTEYILEFQDRLHLETTDGDYTSIEAAMRKIQPDIVYHLATYYTGGHGPEATPALIASNITFSAYLLEAMSTCGCSALVYASTIMAHYRGEAYCPLNLYAATKQAFSDLLAYYTDAGLVKAVTLVLSDTYGPGDRRPKILNLVAKAARTGEWLALSDGEQDFDTVYIDDVTAAFAQAGEQLVCNRDWKNETFQVCASAPLTLRQTVEKMIKINGLMLHATWGKRPQPEREIRRAVRRYPQLPGWDQQVSLDEGLSCFIGGGLP